MANPAEIPWSKERCTLCVEILRAAQSYREGLAEIAAYLKRPVTPSALRMAFDRYGFDAPVSYVNASAPSKTDPAPAPSGCCGHAPHEGRRCGVCTNPGSHFESYCSCGDAKAGAPVSDLALDDEDTVTDRPAAVMPAAETCRVQEIYREQDTAEALPTACRAYVERPAISHALPPLDLGSRTIERVLLIPDTHAPYHDPGAWSAMMTFARAFRPDTIVHVGDLIDCFTISDHDKDPRRGTQLEEELKATKALREEMDSLGAQRKVISLGNHCDRLERYCMRHAPALISMLRIEGLLGLPEHGWHVVPYRQHGSVGRLHFTHEVGFAGVHAVHHSGVAFSSSVTFGHTHRLGASYFGDVLGKRHVSASLGWLGSMPAASYEHAAKKMRYWQHGFGTALVEREGDFRLDLVPIVDGRVIGGAVAA